MWKSPLLYSLHDDSSRVKQHLDRKIFSLKLIIKPDTRTQITHGLIPEVMFDITEEVCAASPVPKSHSSYNQTAGRALPLHTTSWAAPFGPTHTQTEARSTRNLTSDGLLHFSVHSSFWLIHSKQSLDRKTLACEARHFSMQARKAWSPISDD